MTPSQTRSEAIRVANSPENHIIVPGAMSAARVVYDYYGGVECFPAISEEMMAAVDKADAARFSESDILDPQGWILMSLLMDPRTGLGRFREFRISNYQLMMQLVDDCTQMTVEEILQTPDVAERVALYNEHSERAAQQIRRCSKVQANLVVLDLRDEEVIHPTNRFMIYALHPSRTSPSTSFGVSSSRTRSSPPASRSSTARRGPTSAS
jgi:hypothetical protein